MHPGLHQHYENVIEQSEVGTNIMKRRHRLASGLEKCMAGESCFSLTTRIRYGPRTWEENTVSTVLLGLMSASKEGSASLPHRQGRPCPWARRRSGRVVVTARGQPIDGAGLIETTEFRAIESPPPGIIDRQPVGEPCRPASRPSTYDPHQAAASVSRSATARPARPPSHRIPSSTRRARMSSASMSPSVRSAPPWQTWCRA